jgi:DNA-binding transcriptional regulator YiaG
VADLELCSRLAATLLSMPSLPGCSKQESVIRYALTSLRQPYLGVVIYQMRIDLGLSQAALAVLLDVSAASVNAWESNRTTPMRPGSYLYPKT